MSKVLEHVGVFLGKNSRKEEINDFRNERDNQKSKDPDYCIACLVSQQPVCLLMYSPHSQPA